MIKVQNNYVGKNLNMEIVKKNKQILQYRYYYHYCFTIIKIIISLLYIIICRKKSKQQTAVWQTRTVCTHTERVDETE